MHIMLQLCYFKELRNSIVYISLLTAGASTVLKRSIIVHAPKVPGHEPPFLCIAHTHTKCPEGQGTQESGPCAEDVVLQASVWEEQVTLRYTLLRLLAPPPATPKQLAINPLEAGGQA